MTKKIGLTWRVHPEKLDEYRNVHLNPWPELIEALQAHGIHNYNIFQFGDRMFAFLETDTDDALAKVQEHPVMPRWNDAVLPWVYPTAADDNDAQFLELERIFYCE